MKSHARVVIVGGGIMGVGLLYHLALEGWTDVVLVEKGELTSGSTWHAAGQCPHFNGSLNMTKVHVYGTEALSEAGEADGSGGRMARLRRPAAGHHGRRSPLAQTRLRRLESGGLRGEIIGPSEIAKYHPFLDTFGVKAAFLTVTDGHVAPADVTNAMAAGARALGAEIYRRTRVTDIRQLATGEWRSPPSIPALRLGHRVDLVYHPLALLQLPLRDLVHPAEERVVNGLLRKEGAGDKKHCTQYGDFRQFHEVLPRSDGAAEGRDFSPAEIAASRPLFVPRCSRRASLQFMLVCEALECGSSLPLSSPRACSRGSQPRGREHKSPSASSFASCICNADLSGRHVLIPRCNQRDIYLRDLEEVQCH